MKPGHRSLTPAVLWFIASGLVRPEAAAAQDISWVAVPPGELLPLYADSARVVKVQGFRMQATQVTNAQYLEFLRRNPSWQRSRVKPVFAEERYLSHWAGDTVPGAGAPPGSPVVNVSWFAAKAYCDWCGGRLPSITEWEYVAASAPTGRKEQRDGDLLALYERMPAPPLPSVGGRRNAFGIYDLHGLVWEWNLDYSAVLLGGDSRKGGAADRDLFCAAGGIGSIDPTYYAAFLRYSFRGSLKAAYTLNNLGFRCVKDM